MTLWSSYSCSGKLVCSWSELPTVSLLDKRPSSGLWVEGVGDGKGVASVRCKPSKLHDAVFVVDAVAETDVTGKRGKVKK